MTLNEAFFKALTISTENNMVFPQSKYPWTNEAAIVDILRPCRSEDDYTLIYELFHQLNDNIVDNVRCYDLLCEMALAIKKEEQRDRSCFIKNRNWK